MFMHVRPDHTLTLETAWKSVPGWQVADRKSMLGPLLHRTPSRPSRKMPTLRGRKILVTKMQPGCIY